jgi:hypothetical protein
MFASNPFAELSATISPGVMQTYVFLMFLCVAGGTIFDTLHKKSAKYFFDNWRKSEENATKKLDKSEVRALALQTAASEVLTSSEFCNPKRRMAHLLTMYGFLLYVISTVIMVFFYPTDVNTTPGLWTFLWTLGALMVAAGGYWFWFFIRVDVSAEGQSPFRLIRADLFIVSLFTSVTFGLIWALMQSAGSSLTTIFLGLYLIATTVLFGSVPWSKFSHMFFKPAAALQKRVEKANGSRCNLPAPADEPEIYGTVQNEARNY